MTVIKHCVRIHKHICVTVYLLDLWIYGGVYYFIPGPGHIVHGSRLNGSDNAKFPLIQTRILLRRRVTELFSVV